MPAGHRAAAPPPSYTYETLEALGAMLPRARLRLALGWDAYQDFACWRHAERIVADAELLVFARAGTQGPSRVDPAALAARLPDPWRETVRPDGAGTLVTAEGRTVLRFLDLAFPEVAARDILEARRLEQVPEPARALLAEHWHRSGEA